MNFREIILRGWDMMSCYTCQVCKTNEFVDLTMDNKLEDKIRDVVDKSFAKVMYENMSTNVENLLSWFN